MESQYLIDITNFTKTKNHFNHFCCVILSMKMFTRANVRVFDKQL